jgi:carbonic anhydrase/acetyltransferase-like protein (isoleucine patch superfamily)
VNVQDCAVIHPQPGVPVLIGDDVTIGHGSIVHGKKVGNGCLIGMGAVLLEGSVIGGGCIIGAGALIPERRVVPPRSVVRGVPGRIAREVTEQEAAYSLKHAAEYIALAEAYAAGKIKTAKEA